MLNQSTLSTDTEVDTEVVVCPSQVYVQAVAEKLRGDIGVTDPPPPTTVH